MKRGSAGIRTGDAGYTLIELLVVLSVIGLLLLSTPTLVSAAFPGVRTKSAAQELAMALRRARQTAVLNGVETSVALRPGGASYVFEPGAVAHTLPSGVFVTVMGDATQRARVGVWRFFPDGSSSGGTARVVSGNHAHTVTNHPLTGRIGVDE